MTQHSTQIDASAAFAKELEFHGASECAMAIVLGSGLGALADELKESVVLGAADLEHLPGSSVPGHAGCIVLGTLRGVRVLIQQGRIHLYEGWPVADVTRAVRAFARLGIKDLMLTNAAGCMVRDWEVGGFMRLTDQINLQGRAPLQDSGASRGSIYSTTLAELADGVARDLGMDLHRGIYAGLCGPSYETPAEIRMLRSMGADAVGMSTVAEASAARAGGMRVLGLSCLSNFAAGIESAPLCHSDVVKAGSSAMQTFLKFASALLPAAQATPN
jgi:purine-nucleoside phosphorylase